MANNYFLGTAPAVAQVDTFTPSEPDTGDIFSITASDDEGHSSTISFTTGATQTVQAVVEGLQAAAVAAKALGTAPWDEITATEDDTKVTLTVDTAGKPITYATDATGGETLTAANTTANSGPYDWNTLANWSGDGDLPGADASDTVYVEGATIKYGLDQSGISNALTALYVTRSQIGQNPVDGLPPSYLKIKASACEINYHSGPTTPSFSSPVNVDFGNVQTAVVVHNSGTNSVTTQAAVNLKANHASSTIQVKSGRVGVANNSGETATVSKIEAVSGYCYIGAGVTLTTFTQQAGDAVLGCAATTVNHNGGTLETRGSGAITTLNNAAGAVTTCNSTGTVSALNAYGTADFTKSTTARTVTTPKYGRGGIIKFDPSVLTRTNEIAPIPTTGNITLTAA